MFRQATIRNPDRLPRRHGAERMRFALYRIGYSGSGWGRSVSHASRRGAERPMVSGVATPLHVTQPEHGRLQATLADLEHKRLQDDRFGVSAQWGLSLPFGAAERVSAYRLEHP